MAMTAACDMFRVPVDFGPLAITNTDPQIINAALGGRGFLAIDDECVVLSTDDGRFVTLVFRERQVQWIPATRELRFDDAFLGSLILANSATLEVGGADMEPDAGGWIVKPKESCPVDLFEVHAVKPIP